MAHALQRALQYERKLSSLGQKNRRDKLQGKRKPPDGASDKSLPVTQGEKYISNVFPYFAQLYKYLSRQF